MQEILSGWVSDIVLAWARLTQNIDPQSLPSYAYAGFSLLALLLWGLVARVLPRPIGGVSWLLAVAVLFTPTSALGESGVFAPASIAALHAILMGEQAAALKYASYIVAVFTLLLMLGTIWQIIRAKAEPALLAKHRAEIARVTATLDKVGYPVE